VCVCACGGCGGRVRETSFCGCGACTMAPKCDETTSSKRAEDASPPLHERRIVHVGNDRVNVGNDRMSHGRYMFHGVMTGDAPAAYKVVLPPFALGVPGCARRVLCVCGRVCARLLSSYCPNSSSISWPQPFTAPPAESVLVARSRKYLRPAGRIARAHESGVRRSSFPDGGAR
jgi:hypothetical protein